VHRQLRDVDVSEAPDRDRTGLHLGLSQLNYIAYYRVSCVTSAVLVAHHAHDVDVSEPPERDLVAPFRFTQSSIYKSPYACHVTISNCWYALPRLTSFMNCRHSQGFMAGPANPLVKFIIFSRTEMTSSDRIIIFLIVICSLLFVSAAPLETAVQVRQPQAVITCHHPTTHSAT